jgi:hypothetical protein
MKLSESDTEPTKLYNIDKPFSLLIISKNVHDEISVSTIINITGIETNKNEEYAKDFLKKIQYLQNKKNIINHYGANTNIEIALIDIFKPMWLEEEIETSSDIKICYTIEKIITSIVMINED